MRGICLLVLLVSVLLVLTPQPLLAEEKGANRPLSGSLNGWAQLFWDQYSVCHPGPTTITTASGHLSHLGLVAAYMSHCPAPPDSGLPTTHGSLTLIAANGDQLSGTYEDLDGLPPFVVTLQGGTGRFKNAEGTANLDWAIESTDDYFKPFRWWTHIEGRISYLRH